MSGTNSSVADRDPKQPLDVEQAHGYLSAPYIKKERPSVLMIAAVTILALLSISGFVMVAWSTAELHKVRDELDEVRERGVFSTLRQARRYGDGPAMSLFSGSGYWSPGPDMAYSRADHVAVSNDTNIFVMGGTTSVDGDVVVLNKTVCYDIYKQSSTPMADMPTPRHRFNAVLVGGRIYVFGGLNAADIADQPAPLASGMDVYTISTNTWTSYPLINPVTPRTDACAAEVGGKIVMAGGYDRDYAFLSTVEEFNPATNTWRVLPAQLASPRGDCSAVSVGGKMYMMGGVEPSPGFDDCEDDWNRCFVFSARNEVYDPQTGVISRKKDMLNARGDFGATVTAAGDILIAGGETQNRTAGVWREYAHVWVAQYTPRDDVWSYKAPLAQPRFRFAMARAGDTIVAFGGHPTCPEGGCHRVGLNTTLIFSDAQLPDAFVTLQS